MGSSSLPSRSMRTRTWVGGSPQISMISPSRSLLRPHGTRTVVPTRNLFAMCFTTALFEGAHQMVPHDAVKRFSGPIQPG